MLLVFISLTLTSDVHKPRISVIGCHSLLRIAVRIEIMCVKSMEIKIMSNVSSLSCPLSLPAFSAPLLSVFFFPPSAPVPTPCHLCPCVGDSHPCNMGPHVCRWPCCWVACQEEWWPLFNSAASDEVGVRPLGPRPLRVPEAISSLPKVITPRVGGRMFPFPGHNSWGCLLNVFDLEIVSS